MSSGAGGWRLSAEGALKRVTAPPAPDEEYELWFAREVAKRLWDPDWPTCPCPCHQTVQPGLVPCPNCEQSSRYERHD